MNGKWKVIRDVVITMTGAILLAYEAVRSSGNGSPRDALVAAYLCLLLGPTTYRATQVAQGILKKLEGNGDAKPSSGQS